MIVKGQQNIFDFTLQEFGTLENLFDDVLVPNFLNIDGEIQSNQEVNINAVGKGDDDVKMKISEQGLSMTNGDIPIIVEYRNGIVTDAVFGETATFDFEAKINSSTPVIFTVNWGTEVGTTVINSTLVNGVWKALQTTIAIPEGISANQTINVTDNFGGSYEVNYTIVQAAFKITIDTSLGTGDNFQLPLPNQTMNFIVDWGDSSQDTITAYNQAETLHTYSGPFSGQITITGKCGGWSFNNLGDKLKITSVDEWGDVEFDYLERGFYGCSNLTALPSESMTATSNLLSINSLFRNSGITTIPSGIFDNLTNLTSIQNAFQVTSVIIIPVDLFRQNVNVTNFSSCFQLCSSLTTIPVDLFRYNINVTAFISTFEQCLALRSLPNNLFYYNSLVTAYLTTFSLVRSIALPAVLFNLSNLSIVTTFLGFMNAANTGLSSTGTIQDIWNYTTANGNFAFLNQTALSNYASIPAGWK